MSIYRARLRNTSNALSPRVSSEQIRLQVPPKLFGVDSWIPQTIWQWIPDCWSGYRKSTSPKLIVVIWIYLNSAVPSKAILRLYMCMLASSTLFSFKKTHHSIQINPGAITFLEDRRKQKQKKTDGFPQRTVTSIGLPSMDLKIRANDVSIGEKTRPAWDKCVE